MYFMKNDVQSCGNILKCPYIYFLGSPIKHEVRSGNTATTFYLKLQFEY